MAMGVNGIELSNIAPIVNDKNAVMINLPFNLISDDSDLRDSRANKVPVIKTNTIQYRKYSEANKVHST